MTEPTTEAQHVNSSGPEDQAHDAGPAAAAAPCGCADKLETLEAQLGRTDRVIRMVGQLQIVLALSVLYLLWQSWPKGD
jgi:hypothetical protein